MEKARSQSASTDIIRDKVRLEGNFLDPAAAQIDLQDPAVNSPGKISHGRKLSLNRRRENIKLDHL
jgi:hypothetical protein